MYLQHERNSPLIGVICESQYRGRVEQFLNLLKDGFPQEMWTSTKHTNPYQKGMINKYRLSSIRFVYQECSGTSPEAYKDAIEKLLSRLPTSPDLAIVQIKENSSHPTV